MRDFHLKAHGHGSTVRVVMQGELDMATSRLLEEELVQIADGSAERVVLDLRNLTFMDSTGLCVILRADARAREAGRTLVVVRGPEAVDKVFRLTKTDEMLIMVSKPERLFTDPLVARPPGAGSDRSRDGEPAPAPAGPAARDSKLARDPGS
jgi:anti-sigma B factor antagonist